MTNSASDRGTDSKPAAVEVWRSVLDDLEGDTEDERFLLSADIHDRRDRMEIEEIIDHGDVSNGSDLADAFDSLRREFDDWW